MESERVAPDVLALVERIRSLRDEEWCAPACQLLDDITPSTMPEWFNLPLFDSQPDYWLHVYYVANPDGAKRLFRKTLTEFFRDKRTDVRARLFDLGSSGELLDNEDVGKDNRFGAEKYFYVLLEKACAFLRDKTPLAVTWSVRPLIICRAIDTRVPTRSASKRLIKHWRTQTSIQEWSGAA